MSRLSPAFVLGYHGCDAQIAEKLIAGSTKIRPSKNDWDWLGSGAYFWEADEDRALQWSNEQVAVGKYRQAAVVGAVIDLRNCLNLSTQEGVSLLRDAYQSYRIARAKEGQPLAINRDPSTDTIGDLLYRPLDNAVIERLHMLIVDGKFAPFDTVRGMFREGQPVYSGAGFWEKTHVQIAVRTTDCIIGYFRPRKRRSD